MKKIILVGYMGSGKSTIAKLLGDKIGFPSYDLDDCIEKNQNSLISQIFNLKGELFFRKVEHQLFAEILAKNENLVLSLGGGTPCYYNNHESLSAKNVISIYLKASIDTLFDRLNTKNNSRPLLSGIEETEKKEFIAKHLFERSFFYHKAQHIIVVDDQTPEKIVAEIQKILF